MPPYWERLAPPWIRCASPPPAAIWAASSHGLPLEVIRPRALSGATSCSHRPQRLSCRPTALAFFCRPNGIPIKSTVPQLEFGRIYLVQGSKSHCLTSFSHVAPFLESVTEKMGLVISCNRILLGFFVFFFSGLFNTLKVHLGKCL